MEQRKTHLHTLFLLVCTTGIALALTTLLLKYWPVPCITGDCSAVIHSPYGNVQGVPVSLFGLAGWILLLTVPSRIIRYHTLGAMVIGSLYFTGVQYWILQSFCIFCLLHALCVLCVIFLIQSPIPRTGRLIPVLLTGMLAGTFIYSGNKIWAEQSLENSIPEPLATTPAFISTEPIQLSPISAKGTTQPEVVLDYPQALPWLSPHRRKGLLIMSLSCPHCVELMHKAMEYNYLNQSTYPLVFQTNARSFEHTAVFLAALLTQEPHEALPMALALVPKHTLLSGPAEQIETLLNPAFPTLHETLPRARNLLTEHKQFLESIGNPGTPLLLGPQVHTSRIQPSQLGTDLPVD